MALATFQNVVDDLRVLTHATATEASDADMLALAKIATRHINGLGALLTVNDATITLTQSVYQYTIDDRYFWVQKLEYEDPVDASVFWEQVPSNHWGMRSVSGTAKFEFNKALFDNRFASSPGNKVRVTGQGHATEPTALDKEVDDQILSATQQAMQHLILSRLSQGRSELSFDRSAQRRETLGILADLDLSLPDFRVLPNSRRVPTVPSNVGP